MVISEERKADAVVLALSGRLDAMSGKTFEDRILGVIHSGTQRLVLDLPHSGSTSAARASVPFSSRPRRRQTEHYRGAS